MKPVIDVALSCATAQAAGMPRLAPECAPASLAIAVASLSKLQKTNMTADIEALAQAYVDTGSALNTPDTEEGKKHAAALARVMAGDIKAIDVEQDRIEANLFGTEAKPEANAEVKPQAEQPTPEAQQQEEVQQQEAQQDTQQKAEPAQEQPSSADSSTTTKAESEEEPATTQQRPEEPQQEPLKQQQAAAAQEEPAGDRSERDRPAIKAELTTTPEADKAVGDKDEDKKEEEKVMEEEEKVLEEVHAELMAAPKWQHDDEDLDKSSEEAPKKARVHEVDDRYTIDGLYEEDAASSPAGAPKYKLRKHGTRPTRDATLSSISDAEINSYEDAGDDSYKVRETLFYYFFINLASLFLIFNTDYIITTRALVPLACHTAQWCCHHCPGPEAMPHRLDPPETRQRMIEATLVGDHTPSIPQGWPGGATAINYAAVLVFSVLQRC